MAVTNLSKMLVHITLLIFEAFIVIGTVRYVASFYSNVDTLGDKRIAVLFSLVIISLIILLACYLLRKIIHKDNNLLKKIEIGVPLSVIFVNIAVAVINFKDLF